MKYGPSILCSVLLTCACASPGQRQSQDLEAFGRLVAQHLELSSGSPVEVRTDFHCWSRPCTPDAAADFARGFTEVLDVEVLRRPDTAWPVCPWSRGYPEAVRGFRVQARRPDVDGDTARMEVRNSCEGIPEGFIVTYEFLFSRDSAGTWSFVSKGIVAIT